jgi:uncharacterized protein (TIGR00290 family)
MSKAVFTWSSGKDSAFALNEMMNDGKHDVVALLTTVTRDYGRISMHGVREELLDLQAAAIGLPVEKVYINTKASNEDYEKAMGDMLARFREEGVFTVGIGDIFLEDLRKYREERLAEVGMVAEFPIWQRDTTELAQEFIDKGFKAVVTCVDTEVMDGAFSGREYDASFLKDLPEGIDPCGENGEFHSFCYDGPMFKKPVPIERGEVVLKHDRFMFCDLI